MTDYSVDVGDIGKYEIPLAANTQSTVTFAEAADPAVVAVARVEVKCLSGTAPVYFRVAGAGPATVKGDDCWDVHPGTAVVVDAPEAGPTVVRLISAADAVVSVSDGG